MPVEAPIDPQPEPAPTGERRYTVAVPQAPATAQRQPAPPRGLRRGEFVAIAAAMLVLVLGGTALGYALAGDDQPAGTPAAATTTGPALSPEAQVECVNVEKAYNAWNGIGSIGTAADVAALNDLTGKMRADDGETFLEAVTGYSDQPSKELAVAIAAYNFELGLINFQLTAAGKDHRC